MNKFMSNILLKLLICTITILMVSGCTNSLSKENKNIYKRENEILDIKPSEEEIINTIKDLTVETRVLGTEGEKKAAKYLKDKMEHYGYKVEYQDFEVFKRGNEEREFMNSEDIDEFLDINPMNRNELKGIARNIIVKSKKFDENKKSLYLVAHYDTTEATTGVYDNATGVSAVTEVARLLQNYNNKDFNIVFVFFSAEEYYKMGSRYYINQLSEEERKNILGAINIDMVGYTGFKHQNLPKIGNVEILLNPWIKKDALETLFNLEFNNKYSVNNEMGGLSDDLSFARLGVPTLYIADKNFDTGYIIEEESTKIQLEPVNTVAIKDLCIDIYNFILNFNINKFNQLNSISDKEKGTFKDLIN